MMFRGIGLAVLALLIAIAASAPAVAASPASEGGQQVVDFMFDLTHGDQKLREALEQAAGQESPEVAGFVRSAFEATDLGRLRDELGGEIAVQLTEQDVAEFQSFLQSSAGRSLMQAAAASTDTSGVVAAVQNLPKAEQQAIEGFLASPAFQKAVAAISSPQVVELARRWGEQVGCEYAKAHPDLYDLETAVKAGVCPPL